MGGLTTATSGFVGKDNVKRWEGKGKEEIFVSAESLVAGEGGGGFTRWD